MLENERPPNASREAVFSKEIKEKLLLLFPGMPPSNMLITELSALASFTELQSNPNCAIQLIKNAFSLYPKTETYSSHHGYNIDQISDRLPEIVDIFVSPIRDRIESELRKYIGINRGKREWSFE